MTKAENAAAEAGELVGKPMGNFITRPDTSVLEEKKKEKPRSQFTGGKHNTPGRQAYFIQKGRPFDSTDKCLKYPSNPSGMRRLDKMHLGFSGLLTITMPIM